MLNKNRSDFMLEAACREAENVLLDQRLFLVDDSAWQTFEALIDAAGKIRRNMPNPVPVMVLGRLAIDQQWQHAGIGRGLLKDALLRSLSVSKQAGIRALLVHALPEHAKHFYARNGFLESPLDPMTLMIALQDAAH